MLCQFWGNLKAAPVDIYIQYIYLPEIKSDSRLVQQLCTVASMLTMYVVNVRSHAKH